MRKDVFLEIGQFNTDLAVAFNDVLLCLEALKHGYRNVVLNTVELIHHESKSRGRAKTLADYEREQKELDFCRAQAEMYFRLDPCYNLNCSPTIPYFLKF